MRRVLSFSREAQVRLRPFQPERSDQRMVEVKIICQVLDWQFSSLTQIGTLLLHVFSTMENLYIYENLYSPPNWKDDIESPIGWTFYFRLQL
jgi:hypothetical protein